MKGLTKGDRVLHAQYGTGTVTDVNEYHTLIDFDAHGLRKFVTSLVVFEPTKTVAPARAPRAGRNALTGGRPRSR